MITHSAQFVNNFTQNKMHTEPDFWLGFDPAARNSPYSNGINYNSPICWHSYTEQPLLCTQFTVM